MKINWFNMAVYAIIANTTISLANFWMVYNEQKALENSFEIRRSINVTLTDMIDIETGVRGYAITKENSFLEPYERGMKMLHRDLKKIYPLIEKDPAQVDKIDDLEEKIKKCLITSEKLIEERGKYPSKQSPEIIKLTAEGKEKMDDLRSTVDEMRDQEYCNYDFREARLNWSFNWILANIVGSFLAQVAIMFHLGFSRKSKVKRIEWESMDQEKKEKQSMEDAKDKTPLG